MAARGHRAALKHHQIRHDDRPTAAGTRIPTCPRIPGAITRAALSGVHAAPTWRNTTGSLLNLTAAPVGRHRLRLLLLRRGFVRERFHFLAQPAVLHEFHRVLASDGKATVGTLSPRRRVRLFRRFDIQAAPAHNPTLAEMRELFEGAGFTVSGRHRVRRPLWTKILSDLNQGGDEVLMSPALRVSRHVDKGASAHRPRARRIETTRCCAESHLRSQPVPRRDNPTCCAASGRLSPAAGHIELYRYCTRHSEETGRRSTQMGVRHQCSFHSWRRWESIVQWTCITAKRNAVLMPNSSAPFTASSVLIIWYRGGNVNPAIPDVVMVARE